MEQALPSNEQGPGPAACASDEASGLVEDRLQSHPLYDVLERLVREVLATVMGCGMDPAWTLDAEIGRALQNRDVRDRVFVQGGRVRYHPSQEADEFMLATLGLYDAMLASLHALRIIPPAAAAAAEVIASVPLPDLLAPSRTGKHVMDDTGSDEKRSRRLPQQADEMLKTWLIEHVDHPFPNDDEKDEMVLCTGLTHRQINNYFINARRRFLKTLKPPKHTSAAQRLPNFNEDNSDDEE
jgi:hypothetical protein